jgi:hypothetical protein
MTINEQENVIIQLDDIVNFISSLLITQMLLSSQMITFMLKSMLSTCQTLTSNVHGNVIIQ